MDRLRSTGKGRATASRDNLSQPNHGRRRTLVTLSQPAPCTSTHDSSFAREGTYEEERGRNGSQRSRQDKTSCEEEENRLAVSTIRYLFALDRGKQAINRTRIIKAVLGGQGKYFYRVMTRTKNLLSKIFGYGLVELEGNKYLLVNTLRNDLPHLCPSGAEGARQVLLFLVLTHIFMREESCGEDALWDFLTNLGAMSTDNESHAYFGNVKRLITEDFVAQKYLDRVIAEKGDPPKLEYKWGMRAEHELSRRAVLEFVSQVYNGRSTNSWPLQYKAVITREKADNS